VAEGRRLDDAAERRDEAGELGASEASQQQAPERAPRCPAPCRRTGRPSRRWRPRQLNLDAKRAVAALHPGPTTRLGG
jgi:hypothetical protein